MLSQKTRYALKAMLELAAQPEGVTLSATAIAARRSIPLKFLEAILVELKRDDVVRGQRGRGGGYQLARSAADISFGNVVRLMEGPLGLLPCVSVTQYRRCSDCSDNDSCELKKVFRAVRDSTSAILDAWTLADALGKTGSRKMQVSLSTGMKPNPRAVAKKSSARKRSGKGE